MTTETRAVQLYFIATKAHTSIHPRGVMLFWAPNKCGYSTTLERAGRYSESEAKDICGESGRSRRGDCMIACELVEAEAWRVVDIDKFKKLTGVKP